MISSNIWHKRSFEAPKTGSKKTWEMGTILNFRNAPYCAPQSHSSAKKWSKSNKSSCWAKCWNKRMKFGNIVCIEQRTLFISLAFDIWDFLFLRSYFFHLHLQLISPETYMCIVGKYRTAPTFAGCSSLGFRRQPIYLMHLHLYSHFIDLLCQIKTN